MDNCSELDAGIIQCLNDGANIHFRKNDSLRLASTVGNASIVQLLLDRGADLHAGEDIALRSAADNGNLEVARILLDRGANLHAKDDLALRWAAAEGHCEMVCLLLDRGADIHADNDDALRLAVDGERLDVVRELLARGAHIHAEEDYALRQSADCGNLLLVDLLLDRGANIHARRDDAIRVAATRGHRAVVTRLLERRAVVGRLASATVWDHDLDVVFKYLDPAQRPSLLVAVKNKACRCAAELIRLGANPDGGGGAAVRWAVAQDDPAMVATLIACGASIHGIEPKTPRVAEVFLAEKMRRAVAHPAPVRERNRLAVLI